MPAFELHEIVAVGQIVELAQVFIGEVFLLHEVHGVFGLIVPAEGAIAQGHPEAGFGHGVGKPLEMLGDIEESRGRAEEIAVVILRLSHRQPGVVEERIELVAGAELLILGRRPLLFGLHLDRMELDRLLHLLDRALEIARGLRALLVGAGFRRMD